jgi:hypothetical protein
MAAGMANDDIKRKVVKVDRAAVAYQDVGLEPLLDYVGERRLQERMLRLDLTPRRHRGLVTLSGVPELPQKGGDKGMALARGRPGHKRHIRLTRTTG